MRRVAGFVLALAMCAWATPQEGPQVMTRGNATAGTISAIKGDTLTLKSMAGGDATVKLTDKTEYRNGQDPAKLADFKVGDMVVVRGTQENGVWTAERIIRGMMNG